MTRALPRANLNTSRLVRFLTDLSVADVEIPPQQLAEKLGHFLNFSDAVTLSAAHEKNAKNSFESTPVEQEVVEADFLQARNTLITSIVRSCAPNAGSTRIKLPTLKLDQTFNVKTAYEAYHRFYVAHQQHIDTSVRSLRAALRDTLSGASLQLQQLAVLDAALDDILWEKSRKLFNAVPKLLEKHFEYLFNTHQQTLAAAQQQDNPTRWQQPGGWLAHFCKDMQGLLLAELDVRLQPALGLVEAFRKEAFGKEVNNVQ